MQQPQPVELTLEQRFTIASFEQQVAKMSEAQAKTFLMHLHEQLIVREALYRSMLRQEWGIEPLNLDGMG